MQDQKQKLGCLSLIGAVTLALVSLPLAFYAVVYMLARRSGKLPPRIQRWISTYYFPTTVTQEHQARLPRVIAGVGQAGHILDVGTSNVLPQLTGAKIVGLNVVRNSLTHVQGDAHVMPFADAAFDAVFCFGVFEHLQQPWLTADEIWRVLKPGGTFYMEVPFIFPYHPDPDDYYRYTISGLRSLFRRFVEVESGICNGPGSMLNMMLPELIATAADIDGDFDDSRLHISPPRYLRAKEAGKLIAGPLKYLDHWLTGKEHSYVLASGFFYHGTK